MTDLTKLDPFTTIWRSPHGQSKQGRTKCFHLDPECPFIGPDPLKGRLGSVLLTKRSLCSYEAGRTTQFPHQAMGKANHGGRNRPLEALGVQLG